MRDSDLYQMGMSMAGEAAAKYTDVRPLHVGRTWEEMTVGSMFRTDRRTITESDLQAFITLGIFVEPLFLDASNAAESNYTGRLCPGGMTYMFAEGLVLLSQVFHGTGMAFLGMELKVLGPVYVGDTIECIVEVTEARPSKGGERGVVTSKVTVLNQRGDEVMYFTPARLIRGRNYVVTSSVAGVK
jgi:acyl dehydratase